MTDFDAKLKELIENADNLTAGQLERVRKLLETARTETVARLAQTEWDAYHIPQMETAVRDVMAAFESKYKTDLNGSLVNMWENGAASAAAPLEALGIELAAPQLSMTALGILSEYSADRITNLAKDAVAKINDEIMLGVMGQKSLLETIERIGKNLDDASVFRSITSRAETIARTEMATVNSNARQAKAEQIAKYHPDKPFLKKWIHSGKPAKTRRSEHYKLDGKTVKVNEEFAPGIPYPHAPGMSARDTVNCGCSHVVFLDKEWLSKAPERLEKERLERERIEKERIEKERLDQEKAEKAAKEKAEKAAKEKAEKEKAEKAAKEKAEKEKAEKAAKEKAEKAAKEKAEKAAKEKAEKEKAEKAAKEKAEKEKAEKEKAEKAAKEKAEKAAKEKAEKEKAEKAAKEKAEKEKAEKAAKEKAEKAAKEKAEKAAKEKAEKADLLPQTKQIPMRNIKDANWSEKASFLKDMPQKEFKDFEQYVDFLNNISKDDLKEARKGILTRMLDPFSVQSDDIIKKMEKGTSHIPNRLLADLERKGMKIDWQKKPVRAYYNSAGRVTLDQNDTFDIVSHEVAHAVDHMMSNDDEFIYNTRYGLWNSAYASEKDAEKYKKIFDAQKYKGKKGGIKIKNGEEFHKGNWVEMYDGRAYKDNEGFGHQFWAMNSQRYAKDRLFREDPQAAEEHLSYLLDGYTPEEYLDSVMSDIMIDKTRKSRLKKIIRAKTEDERREAVINYCSEWDLAKEHYPEFTEFVQNFYERIK